MNYSKSFRSALLCLIAVVAWNMLAAARSNAVVIDFEDPALALSAESQWDGVDDTFGDGVGQPNAFESGGAVFNNNNQHESWGHAWQGWAYSNRTDTGATGFAGQYTAMADPAGGDDGSAQYGVGFAGFSESPQIDFGGLSVTYLARFTNNAYAHDSMTNDDDFAKTFSGPSGDDPDWFLLSITGRLGGAPTGTVEFYLADYRFADNSQDYIVDDWTLVDLGSLGVVDAIEFAFSSSDNGAFGMNTPAYFAMDSLLGRAVGGLADFDADGDVDGDDFGAWQAGFGSTIFVTHQDGDADVDGSDYLIWQSNFGAGGTAGGGSVLARPLFPQADDLSSRPVMPTRSQPTSSTGLRPVHLPSTARRGMIHSDTARSAMVHSGTARRAMIPSWRLLSGQDVTASKLVDRHAAAVDAVFLERGMLRTKGLSLSLSERQTYVM